jgi:hypothetical protein
VRHSSKIVDLGRLDVGNDGNQVGGVAKISVMKENLDSGLMTVSVDVIDTTSVEARRTTDNTVDLKKKIKGERPFCRWISAMTLRCTKSVRRKRHFSLTYCVALFEQEFSQIRTILTGDTSDQCNLAIRRHVDVIALLLEGNWSALYGRTNWLICVSIDRTRGKVFLLYGSS